jgi:type I restriction enzyme S subunit
MDSFEEMAQALFKEWFVSFRFPGHEQTRFFDSELGWIPEGWEVKQFQEVVQVKGGGTPSTKQSTYWGGNIPWLTPTEVVQNSSRYMYDTKNHITEEGLEKSSANMIEEGAVLLTSRATIGEVVMNKAPMTTNQGFINILPQKLTPYFLYYWLLFHKQFLKRQAIGSTFPEISKSNFRNIPLVVPPLFLQKRFDNIISSFRDQQLENEKLAKARDTLLPRLLNGEIEV